MPDLAIEVTGARVEPYAAVPTVVFDLHMSEASGARVHAVTLHTQVRIEPQRRRYDDGEHYRLLELFGDERQWSESVRPFLWAHLHTTVAGFEAETAAELAMACTYDFEVAGTKYLHALAGGEIPLLFLYSGTVFTRGQEGVSVQPIAWNLESRFRMPVALWRQAMDRYFPGEGWLRLPRTTIDRLQRYRAEQALPTWEQAIDALFKAAGEER